MSTLLDPLNEFISKVAPLTQSPGFPSLPTSLPACPYIELACIAARQGSEWILISGKAALKACLCKPRPPLEKVASLHNIVAFKGCLEAPEMNDFMVNLGSPWVLKGETIRLVAEDKRSYNWSKPYVMKLPTLDWEKMRSLYPDTEYVGSTLLYVLSGGEFEEFTFGFATRYGSAAKALYGKEPGDYYPCLLDDRYWSERFVLQGSGPDVSFLLSNDALQETDNELRSGTPAFNGFDELCTRLGLPVQRGNLVSSLRISADLPAGIAGVLIGRGLLIVIVYSFGPLDLRIDWLPYHEPEKVHSDRFEYKRFAGRVSIKVPRNTTGARLILCYGELQVSVSRVEWHSGKPYCGRDDLVDLEIMPEEPTASDSGTGSLHLLPEQAAVSESAQGKPEIVPEQPAVSGPAAGEKDTLAEIPTPSDSGTGESSEQERPGPIFPDSERARAIQLLFVRKRNASALEICSMLDEEGLVELPEAWKNSPKDRSFEDAYKSKHKDKIDKYVSRIRTCMKERKIV